MSERTILTRPHEWPERVNAIEAGEILGLPAKTVQVLALRGEIPAAKVGRTWTFDVKMVHRLARKGALEVYKARRHATPNAEAVVYFIECAGAVKIGRSRNIASRLRALRTHAPQPIKLIATIAASAGLEQKLHRRFAAYRRNGEWFNPTGDLADYLRKLGWNADE